MNWKKSTLLLACMLVFSGPVLAWQTFDFSGFEDVVRVEIRASFPAPDAAMDNIVFSTASMGFEGVVADDSDIIPVTPYVESGYQLAASATENGVFGKDSGVNSNGTAIFGWCGYCGGPILLTLTQVGDAAFDFLSLDAAPLGTDEDPSGAPSYTLFVTGYFADGSTIDTSVLVRGFDTSVPIPVNSPLMMLMLILVLLGAAAWTFRRLS